MRLKPDARDRLLEDFATRLNGGAIVVYSASPLMNPLQTPLISVPFRSPAFQPVDNGQVEVYDLPPTMIERSGKATWAELVTANGEAIGDVLVRAVNDPNAGEGDILVDSGIDRVDPTEFHRGALCTLTRVTLSLPLQS